MEYKKCGKCVWSFACSPTTMLHALDSVLLSHPLSLSPSSCAHLHASLCQCAAPFCWPPSTFEPGGFCCTPSSLSTSYSYGHEYKVD